jgi:LCP family protein required for cell wall assembly
MKRTPVQINFLSSDAEKKARGTTLLVAGLFTIFVGVLSAVGAGASYRAATRGVSIFSEVGNLFSVTELQHLVWDSKTPTTNPTSTPDGKLNILIMGIGGEGHDGPQLTDSILLATYDKANNRLGLVSVPRDLAYPIGSGMYEKINSVNAYEEQSHPGAGARSTADKFANFFHTRIDRVVRVDFSGFEKFINALGGVDVNIEDSFTDYKYPTNDDGPNPNEWITVSFKKGVEHMDGERALQYARSRHSMQNNEGSDFARSKRQRILIEAVRDRLLSLGTIGNPQKISELWTVLSDHIQTDFTAWDILKLLPNATALSQITVSNRALTDDVNGGLVDGNINGAFMLFPRKSDWSEVRAIVADPFATSTDSGVASIGTKSFVTSTTSSVVTNTKAPTTTKEIAIAPPIKQPIADATSTPAIVTPPVNTNINVEVKNGTNKTGFAAQVSGTLKKNGFSILSVGNAKLRNYNQTVIYDLTEGAKLNDLMRLKNLLHANIAELSPNEQILLPDGSTEDVSASSAQFLIILGNSSANSYVNPKTP